MKKKKLIFPVLIAFISVLNCHLLPAQDEEDIESIFEQLYDIGAQVTEDYLPEDLIEEYELPSYEDWKFFWRELEGALRSYSFEDLAWIQPEVKKALKFLRMVPALKPYSDWLMQRLDYCDVASAVVKAVPVEKAKPFTRAKTEPSQIIPPKKPSEKVVISSEINRQRTQAIQDKKIWEKEVLTHPKLEKTFTLIPQLKKVFEGEGIPPELVWIAEVESSLNPNARSPVGALGLFQLMPETAKGLGLKLTPKDERLDPQKSAKAAAKYLRMLYRQFNSWPLAFAAYNAGEGTVRRLLKKHNANKFEDIAFDLPVETRMYVPKVLTVVELREGKKAESLPAPKLAWLKAAQWTIYVVKWVITSQVKAA